MPSPPTDHRTPWLASGFNRSILVGLLSITAGVATYAWVRGGRYATITAGWSFWGTYCLLGGLTIPLALRRLRGPGLRRALLHADDTGPAAVRTLMQRPRLRALVTGGDAPSWSLGISLTSLFLVLFLILLDRVGRADPVFTAVSVFAIVASWLHMWLNYGLHYARLDARHGGLEFPGDEERVFSDYLYAALAGNVTFGTTDVAVTSARLRRTMTVHALVAFVFNTVILAVLISVLAG